MFRLDVLQNQWLILALVGGLVMVLAAVLAYRTMWRRDEDVAEQAATGVQPVGERGPMPLVLILTIVSLLVFAAVYVLVMIHYPPNW
jgi:F0F1-type ATP synthase assembly protein I